MSMNQEELAELFYGARAHSFEDGVHNPFTRALGAALENDTPSTLYNLKALFAKELYYHRASVYPAHVWRRALIELGLYEGQNSCHAERLLLLGDCLLYARHWQVQGGAILGLKYLAMPASLPILHLARARANALWQIVAIEQAIQSLEGGTLT